MLSPVGVFELEEESSASLPSSPSSSAAAAAAPPPPPPPPRTPASLLPASQARLLRRLPQAPGEVWHVAVRRLRCFALPVDGGVLHEVSRPRALIVARLGQPSLVLRCVSMAPAPDLSGAPAAAASSFSVLEQVARCIVAPRDAAAGGPAHRPATVTFEDRALAAGCAATLAALDVRCELLRGALPLLDRFVSEFSEALLARRVAMATPQSRGMPPLGEPGTGINDAHVRALLSMGRRLVAASPWLAVQGKQTFRIRLAGAGAGEPRVAWASLLGFESIQRRQQVFRDSGGDVAAMQRVPLERGIRLFFKRFDAEQRLLTALPSPDRPVPPQAPPAEPNPADLVCAQCGKTVHAVAEAIFARSGADEGDAAAVEKAYLEAQRCFQRCVGCREVYYCALPPPAASAGSSLPSSADGGSGGGGVATGAAAAPTCQKLHWPAHRPLCQARRSPEWSEKGGQDFRPGFWPALELVCIFNPLHMMCFGDLERFDRLGYVASNIADLPCPLAFARGMPRRPTAPELQWLLRGMAAVMEFVRQRPDLANDTFSPNTFGLAEHEEEVHLAGALPAARRAPSSEAVPPAAAAAAAAPEAQEALGAAGGSKLRRRAVAASGAGGDAVASATRTGALSRDASSGAAPSRPAGAAAVDVEPPWFEAFGEGPSEPLAYVRADAILSPEEARSQRAEVAEVMSTSHDEKAIKPGLFVPSRASFLVGDPAVPRSAAAAAAAAGPEPSRCTVC